MQVQVYNCGWVDVIMSVHEVPCVCVFVWVGGLENVGGWEGGRAGGQAGHPPPPSQQPRPAGVWLKTSWHPPSHFFSFLLCHQDPQACMADASCYSHLLQPEGDDTQRRPQLSFFADEQAAVEWAVSHPHSVDAVVVFGASGEERWAVCRTHCVGWDWGPWASLGPWGAERCRRRRVQTLARETAPREGGREVDVFVASGSRTASRSRATSGQWQQDGQSQQDGQLAELGAITCIREGPSAHGFPLASPSHEARNLLTPKGHGRLT